MNIQQMFYIQILAMAEQILTQVAPYWEYAKQEARNWLGPAPIRFFLMPDGRVLPSSIVLPDDAKEGVFVYDPFSKRITKLLGTEEGRFKQLPYLGIVLKMQRDEIDISEWVGDIRAFPIPECITAKQILTLWSSTQHKYISFVNANISIVKSDGTEETLPA